MVAVSDHMARDVLLVLLLLGVGWLYILPWVRSKNPVPDGRTFAQTIIAIFLFGLLYAIAAW